MTAVVAATDSPDIGRGSALRAAGLLIAVGALHSLTPKFFDSIVPRMLPGAARTYTYLSGVAEPGIGAALVAPRTRRIGGLFAALLFVAVFPANIQYTVDTVNNPKAPRPLKLISVLRLPMRLPLITQALTVRRG